MNRTPDALIGLNESARSPSEFSRGDLIGFWKPFRGSYKYGGSSPPIEWIFEVGEVLKTPPFESDEEIIIPNRGDGYRHREVVGVLKVSIEHPGDKWADVIDYVHPNMIAHRSLDPEDWGQSGWRVILTEDGFPTVLASENYALNYGRGHLEMELPEPPETVDPWDPDTKTDDRSLAADGGRP